eukprot:7713847-Alexandrium_andersonii.AAC.1
MLASWLRKDLQWVRSDFLQRVVALRAVASGRRDALTHMLGTATLRWGRMQQMRQQDRGWRDYK